MAPSRRRCGLNAGPVTMQFKQDYRQTMSFPPTLKLQLQLLVDGDLVETSHRYWSTKGS
jgi:hypothetical protein